MGGTHPLNFPIFPILSDSFHFPLSKSLLPLISSPRQSSLVLSPLKSLSTPLKSLSRGKLAGNKKAPQHFY